MSKNSAFTQNQLYILLGMGAVSIFIFGLAVVYIFFKKDPPIIISSPTNPITSSENAIVLPTTERLIIW
jgi:hypothetical protein